MLLFVGLVTNVYAQRSYKMRKNIDYSRVQNCYNLPDLTDEQKSKTELTTRN